MKTRKSLAFILALVMMLTLIPASAFATTENNMPAPQTVAKGAEFVTELTFKVDKTAIPASIVQKFDVVLENAEWVKTNMGFVTEFAIGTLGANTTAYAIYLNTGLANASTTDIAKGNSNATITFNTSTTGIAVNSVINMTMHLKAGTDTGAVKVTIAPGSGCYITGGTYTVATVAGGTTVTTVPGKVPTIGLDRTAISAAAIRLDEVAKNSLGTNERQEFKLILSRGFEFVDIANYNTISGDLTPGALGGLAIAVGGTDNRELTVRLNTSNSTASLRTLVIGTSIKSSTDAKAGDVSVRLAPIETGTKKIDGATDLVIAKCVEDAVTVTTVAEKDLPTIVPGRLLKDTSTPYTVKVILKESAPESLSLGKYIEFKFPDGVRIATAGSLGGAPVFDNVKYSLNGEAKKFTGFARANTDPATVDSSYFEWTTEDITNTKADEIEFTIPVTVDAAFTGDIKMTVSGARAGVPTTELVVAKTQAPITTEFVIKDVRTGVKNQAVGDITIKENFAGALSDNPAAATSGIFNQVLLSLEGTMQFNKGKISVKEGDIELTQKDGTDVNISGGVIDFQVKHSSFKTPGVIVIKDVAVSLDRTPAEGKFELYVGGDALVRNEKQVAVWGPPAAGEYAYSAAKFSDSVIAVPYLNVATPADQGVNSSFVIGDKTYTVNGVTKEMDAAPYIDAASRTMVPIRYIGYALGLTDYQVLWNPATSTATLFGKSTVVITVGKDTLSVNGAIVPMDTKAVNKDGRIYVPARYIGNALGAQVEWDQAKSTVAIYTVK